MPRFVALALALSIVARSSAARVDASTRLARDVMRRSRARVSRRAARAATRCAVERRR